MDLSVPVPAGMDRSYDLPITPENFFLPYFFASFASFAP
jgi:hypothetical protein